MYDAALNGSRAIVIPCPVECGPMVVIGQPFATVENISPTTRGAQ
jgi:hypothetical protein